MCRTGSCFTAIFSVSIAVSSLALVAAQAVAGPADVSKCAFCQTSSETAEHTPSSTNKSVTKSRYTCKKLRVIAGSLPRESEKLGMLNQTPSSDQYGFELPRRNQLVNFPQRYGQQMLHFLTRVQQLFHRYALEVLRLDSVAACHPRDEEREKLAECA